MLHFFSFISLCRSRALGEWLAAVLRRGREQQTRLYVQGRAPYDSILMCEPARRPGLAPGSRCPSWEMLPGQAPPLSSLRPPVPAPVRRLGRDAPLPARRWAPGSFRLSGLCDRQVLVIRRCPARIALRWVCTAPRPRPCQPCRALSGSAPGNVQALSSRLPGRAQLHFQLLQTFSAFAVPSLWSSSSCACLSASALSR